MGYFKVSSKVNLNEVQVGQRFEESDFSTTTPEGNFVQFQHISEDDAITKYEVKPGVWEVVKTMNGFELQSTSFVKDRILEKFVNTREIEEIAASFIRNIPKYADFGIEVAKRCICLYGPPGTGKTTAIAKVCNTYIADGKTAVVIYHTDKFEASEIKDFTKRFQYVGVEKVIFIAEDLGGVEIEERRMGSDSSLLSLLDNSEKTFTIPTLIIVTTNYPATFMGNLMNRSGRIDDKVEVGYPDGTARQELLKFFSKDSASQEALELIGGDKCKEFPPSHIKEVYIRSVLRDKKMEDVIRDIVKEIDTFKKAYEKRNSVGF